MDLWPAEPRNSQESTPVESPSTISSEARTNVRALSLTEALVVRELRKMNRGQLHITFPDGRSETIGNSGAPFRAALTIHDSAFFSRVVLFGDIGFAEAYIDGLWDTPDITALVAWAIHNAGATGGLQGGRSRLSPLNFLRSWNRLRHVFRRNSEKMSRENIAEHYDLGNAFYQLWLDRTMTYSAARFVTGSESLEDAQTDKYEALCQKLHLAPDDHVLEIGCGWGGFACHAARNHGVKVTAVTISEEQFAYTRGRAEAEGVAHLVDVRFADYRTLGGRFDKIASIEMLEAVGDEFLETFFEQCNRLLKPDGLVALQFITVPDCRHRKLKKDVDFIQKHIFPGSLLLSLARVNAALSRTGDLFLHALEDLGNGYAKTLGLWRERFDAVTDEVKELGFDEAFIRKWRYYLSYCEAAFDTRNITVVQAVYTRPNNYRLSERYAERAGPVKTGT
jgi:cyclopropane-fatty-acyl-phospholipid synthase